MLINDTATTEMYTLSYTTLFRSEIWVEVRPNRNEEVDAQPDRHHERRRNEKPRTKQGARLGEQHVHAHRRCRERSEEHTSELQSHSDLVCRLLLEKKKDNNTNHT